MDGTEHGNHVLIHADIFAEPNGAEERNQVATDGGVIGRGDTAEEIDHILMGLAVETHVAEEDDNVAFHW